VAWRQLVLIYMESIGHLTNMVHDARNPTEGLLHLKDIDIGPDGRTIQCQVLELLQGLLI
jgi:hypothetical protein